MNKKPGAYKKYVCEKKDCLYYDGFSDGVDKAIDIVKGGVVDG